MLETIEIRQALEKVADLLIKLSDIQAQHNRMLLDLYERISEIERTLNINQ
jgi:hypothetical protein